MYVCTYKVVCVCVSTSTLNLHPQPPPSTSTLSLHPQPPPSTSTLSLHPQPPPATSALNLHSQPPLSTFTFNLCRIQYTYCHAFTVYLAYFCCTDMCAYLNTAGQLSIDVCRVGSLADYYPMFWASSADENGRLWHCVSEAAYPRETIVLSYFGLSIVFLLLIRLPLTFLCWRKHPHNNSLCYGLIIVPTIAALFVIFSGLLCELTS